MIDADNLPDLPTALRCPDSLSKRLGYALVSTFNLQAFREAISGVPACQEGCTNRDCIDRAAGRHLRLRLVLWAGALFALTITLQALASTN